MDVLNIGGKFGDYDVLALVGRGSMGAVYRIRDPKTGNEYACKVMFPEVAKRNPEYRKRFAREAAFAMSIRHPNLISVYDVGEDPETGLCYLIMDYVPGGTVEDRLARGGRFPIEEAVSVIAHVASALAVADSKHVVHRDIKPANIMFAADGTPKLADLGIARFNDGSATTTVTSAGMIVGTPAYMAPEQMTDSHSVDIRADIYSLGTVFFEMLTGQRPNEGCSVVELLAKAIKGEGIPDVRTIRPEVSASVAQILNLMCAPKPENRISTPQQVVEMFSRLENGQALIAPSAPRRSRKMTARRRRRMLVRIAAGCGAAALAAVAYMLGGMKRGAVPDAPAGSDAAVRMQAQTPPAPRPSASEGLQFPDPAELLARTNEAVRTESPAATNETAAVAQADAPAAAKPAVPAPIPATNAVQTAAAAPKTVEAPTRPLPSVDVPDWDRKSPTPFDWLSSPPSGRGRPLAILWDFSHGFQLSCSQYTGFTFENTFLGGGASDGESYVSRPVLFSLSRTDLYHADVLVLPTCCSGMPYTVEDLFAVRNFVEDGGTVLVFANEQNLAEQEVLLKDYGVKLHAGKDNTRPLKGVCPVLSGWVVENSYMYGDDVFVYAESDSPDFFPMVVTDDSDRLPLMMQRRSGAGRVVFVSDRLFGRGPAGHVNTRWWRTLMMRCARASKPEGDLVGETMEDAPVKARTGGYRFYGAVSVEKRVKSAAMLAELASPAFEKYDLGLSPVKGSSAKQERSYILSVAGGFAGIHQCGQYDFLVSDLNQDPQYMLVPLLFPAGSAEYRNSPLGYNAYLLTLVLDDCGYRRQAQEARNALAADYKLGRTIAPFEELRTRYRGIFQRAAALSRREDVKSLVKDKITEDDLVAMLSMAAGEDLYPLFRSGGIEVSRMKSEIGKKFVGNASE